LAIVGNTFDTFIFAEIESRQGTSLIVAQSKLALIYHSATDGLHWIVHIICLWISLILLCSIHVMVKNEQVNFCELIGDE
jgi:hypothetical protein